MPAGMSKDEYCGKSFRKSKQIIFAPCLDIFKRDPMEWIDRGEVELKFWKNN